MSVNICTTQYIFKYYDDLHLLKERKCAFNSTAIVLYSNWKSSSSFSSSFIMVYKPMINGSALHRLIIIFFLNPRDLFWRRKITLPVGGNGRFHYQVALPNEKHIFTWAARPMFDFDIKSVLQIGTLRNFYNIFDFSFEFVKRNRFHAIKRCRSLWLSYHWYKESETPRIANMENRLMKVE
jgi:hypothetical protein